MLAHTSLAGNLRLKFLLNVLYNWSYESFNEQIPWQMETHVLMLEAYLRDKEAQRGKNGT